MKHPDELDRLLGGLVPAPPPPEARERTIAAAREALAGRPQPGDIWWRLWTSRPLRLAWAAAVALLLAANALLSVAGPPRHSTPPHPVVAVGPAAPEPELVALTRLPPLRLELLPTLGASPRPGPPTNPAKPS